MNLHLFGLKLEILLVYFSSHNENLFRISGYISTVFLVILDLRAFRIGLEFNYYLIAKLNY